MSTNTHKSSTRKFLEDLRGGPLTFGQMIRSLRVSDEISQVELAEKLHVSRAFLCDIEHDRRLMSAHKAAEFARIMGYSQEQFVAVAIEDQLRNAGMEVHVELKMA
jgi:transcriptional regulator with XRE-family HTH domain